MRRGVCPRGPRHTTAPLPDGRRRWVEGWTDRVVAQALQFEALRDADSLLQAEIDRAEGERPGGGLGAHRPSRSGPGRIQKVGTTGGRI